MARTAARVRRAVRRTGLAFLLGALVLPLAAPPTSAAPTAPPSVTNGPITRWEVIQRAKPWTDAHVPYSMTGRHDGYRTDCSGFVSMAWHLDTRLGGLTTAGLPSVATPIGKNDLAAGDILLMQADDSEDGIGHAAIFVAWANPQHTAYEAMDEEGGEGAQRHVLPYPYKPGYGTFHPYRYRRITDPAPTQNLLVDGGFEDDGGWQAWPGTTFTRVCPAASPAAAAAAPPHGGRCLAAVSTGPLDPSQGPSFFQDVWGARMESGRTYTFTAWVRADGDHPYPGQLALWSLGDGAAHHAATAFVAQPGRWQQVSVVERIPADGCDHLRAQIYEGVSGQVLDVDDADMTSAS